MKYFIVILSIIIICIAPFFGQVEINLSSIMNPLKMDYQIFWDIRLPGTILAFFTGGILSLSGLIFQTIFRNPMSTPFTLGVASGATFFTAIGIVLGFASYISLFAFLGAIITIIILFILSSRFKNNEASSLLLVGIALSFFYSASLMVVFFISNLQESYEIVRFTMGSLDIVGFANVWIVVVAGILLLTLILKYKYEFKLLLTSYQFASLKGINIKKINYTLLLAVSIAVGIIVSIAGPIGFIGLIVPHIIKIFYTQSAHKLIIPIFFYGGVFLVFCDMISRNLGTNSNIPIGVVTSFIGAPFFIYLIIKQRRI
ncbi:Vitamin B12 ABC transporter, permease component BtuC [hydrothermal vent metagenome]|uniref:Vitamin B12 ABC transporter, permease component BtuC n=1 Tax=hydrothermal vent metagenome TaxID=652676 RepID=A0A3B1E5M5_9ZZZZ